jgi:ferredoxin
VCVAPSGSRGLAQLRYGGAEELQIPFLIERSGKIGPEAAISLDRDDYPIIDYDVCKGCLLCVHECPTHALSAAKEVR